MATLAQFRLALLKVSEKDIESDTGLSGALRLRKEDEFEIDYAPFEHIQSKAKIVIVGITPGAQQARNALKKAREVLLSGGTELEAIKSAKVFASFSGPMRSNLVAMLDYVGVPNLLGIDSSAALWTDRSELVHFTSVLRYPVYFKKRNYSGVPSMVNISALTWMLRSFLGQETKELPNALWVPLGPAATTGINWAVEKGLLDHNQVLWGLPHPSGANGERIAYFLKRKRRNELSSKTSPEKIDLAREHIISQIASMSLAAQ
jgi:hypothetical protein